MLSYQHGYHAGNLADVHKHALLATVLDYLTRKDKPLSYIETHAGRGLYDLASAEAAKTGEAAQGISKAAGWFAPDHPYARALAATRAAHGPQAYPGSPLVAAQLLRPIDSLHFNELHPREHTELTAALAPFDARVARRDGWEAALAHCPPTPRRGVLLADPSYEVKAEYDQAARVMAQLHRKWNVGVLMLWYPILADARHRPMTRALAAAIPGVTLHEVRFPPARDGHGMVGSGLAVVNAPWGFDAAAAALTRAFAGPSGRPISAP